jgi:isopenicillin N synthase-like dioxygenase
MAAAVPTIDLTPLRGGSAAATSALAEQVDTACREIGFLVVGGHGVPKSLVEEMDQVTRAFFALPLETKLAVRCDVPSESRGYMPPRSRALALSLGDASPPDLMEYFSIGQPTVPDDPYYARERAGGCFRPNRWPAAPEGFEAVWTEYYVELERLADDLMAVFALALGLPRDWFGPFVDRHCTDLFANHYPPLAAPPAPGQLRLGAHTDYGSLTLLYADGTPGGLQVRRDGAWHDVPSVPGTFVVNIGDLMARWTHDRWVSTLHRVQNPVEGVRDVGRLSIPFFHQPNYDAVIEAIPTCTDPANPPRHAPITSGANLMDKTVATLGG